MLNREVWPRCMIWRRSSCAKRAGCPRGSFQKLVYYAQAWALAWDDEPIFRARIEAWANGPVVPELYRKHRGQFSVDSWESGDARKITGDHEETVDLVLREYGDLTGRQLSLLTHAERPWQEARKGLKPTEYGSHEISLESMQDYYLALDADMTVSPVSRINWAQLEAS